MSGGVDYSGTSDLALLEKWKQLSMNGTGAARIANLIWRDLASNYFVGTRGWLSSPASLPPNLQKRREGDDVAMSPTTGQVSVHVYSKRIRYHWVYGIPATLSLAVTLALCVVAAISVLSRRSGIARIRHYLWSLSPGRMVGAFLFPGQGDARAETRVWIETVGWRDVRIAEAVVDVAGYDGKFSTAGAGTGVHHSYKAVTQDEPTDAVAVTSVEYIKSEAQNARTRPGVAVVS
jgi:hypothetical protein